MSSTSVSSDEKAGSAAYDKAPPPAPSRRPTSTQSTSFSTRTSTRPATEAANAAIKRKFYLRLLPLIFCLNLLLYIDKGTLGQSSILGIYTAADLDNARYADLNTFFYVGFAIGLVPMGIAINRLPVGKFVSGIVLAWAVVIGCHPLIKSFAGLAVLRSLLGFVESAVLPSIVVILNMYFTADEQMVLSNVWYIACSLSSVPAGFIAYGSLFYDNPNLGAWQLFYIIIAAVTVAYSAVVLFFLPDSPATARFLTLDQKVHAIRRLRVNGGVISTNVWKWSQFREAALDVETWFFVQHAFLNQIPNNLTSQYPLLIVDYGFTTFQSTLMSMAFCLPAILAQLGATWMMRRWKKNSIAWIMIIWYIPNTIGGILQLALPFENKAGLLVALYLAFTFCVPWVMGLAWASAASSGHTKKISQSIFFLFENVVSNFISPQLWQAKYLPRYYVPWAIQLVFGWVLAPLSVLALRYYLIAQNRKRAALLAARGEEAAGLAKIIEKDDDGNLVETVVDRSLLDLTDREDLSFVYPY